MTRLFFLLPIIIYILISCKKKDSSVRPVPPPVGASFSFSALKIDGLFNNFTYTNVSISPVIKFSFSSGITQSSAVANFSFKNKNGAMVPVTITFENNDSTVVIKPLSALDYLAKYSVGVT